jgi:hypothetical protein
VTVRPKVPIVMLAPEAEGARKRKASASASTHPHPALVERI